MIDHGSQVLKLFKMAKRIRLVEERIASEYKYWEIRCPVHLSIGQEAVSAAFSIIQHREDFAVSTHRSHAHYLAKGGDLYAMVAELYGKVDGCSRGNGGSMHLFDKEVHFMGSSAIVGNSIPVGVGLAYHIKYNRLESVSYIFLGDGAIEEGVFYESASFSVLHNLPTIFVCENNGYSVYTNILKRQTSESNIENVAKGIGLEYQKVDGNNPIDCLHAFITAVNQQKSSGKPQFIEFITSRKLEHCGPNEDDHLGYRTAAEIQKIACEDPIMKLEGSLSEIVGDDYQEILSGVILEIEKEIESVFSRAKISQFSSEKE